MATKHVIIDLAEIDLDHVIEDQDEIRRYNPQRHEMEQLTAIVFNDPERHISVGYKDVSSDEFWVRGHMPGMPLMPGILMCEAAAQLCCYHVQKNNLMANHMIGFGGLEEVRFRDTVVPGDRLVLAAELLKLRPGKMLIARFQGFVRQNMVVEGKIKGIPLPVDMLTGQGT